MKLFQKIYDLTVPLKEGVINYPGDPPFKMKELSAIDAGNPFELNKISMSTHTGTHIDFPAHFIKKGKRNADFLAEHFILTAIVADDYVYLTEDAADYCIEKKLKLVGIDYISVENPRSDSFTVHRKLLSNEILILENINLTNVPSGIYTLIALPLFIPAAEAAPVRAILTL